MWYRKVLKKHDNSLPQKTTMKPKVQRDLHFLRAGTMSGLEHFLGSEFRNHVLQCPSPPPQQVHQSSTAASKKASRDGKRFHQPCANCCNKKSILNRWTVPSTSYGSDSLPGMKTPTIPWVPQRSEETHIEASAPDLLPRKQMGKTRPTDWDGSPLRFRFCGKMISSLKSHCLKTKPPKPACLWKPMTRQVDYHFFPVKRALSANVQKFKSQMPHNRRHKSSVPSQPSLLSVSSHKLCDLDEHVSACWGAECPIRSVSSKLGKCHWSGDTGGYVCKFVFHSCDHPAQRHNILEAQNDNHQFPVAMSVCWPQIPQNTQDHSNHACSVAK